MSRAALLAAAICLGACQSADVGARAAGVVPEKSTDEAGLWMQSENLEKELKRSALRIEDSALNAYVNSVTCKVAPDICGEIKVHLLESSSFNAYMMPNGTMVVFSGLMLRAENEAQLASVLGHEIGHFEENHSLEQHRTMKRTALFALAGDLAVGGLGSLAAVLSVLGYSREHEREADDIGFARLAKANYSGAEAAKVWSQLIAEFEASDFKRKQKRASRSSVLDTHPAPPERSATLAAKAAAAGPNGTTEQAAYRAQVRPFLGRWLDADLEARDWGMSLHLINRLQATGADLGTLAYYEGEVYRERRMPGDEVKALAAYETAQAHTDAPAATWRALGEAYRKAGRTADARAAYAAYLQRDPAAPDAALISQSLSRLPED
jgi:beta-barrel assembly-enhancing protease